MKKNPDFLFFPSKSGHPVFDIKITEFDGPFELAGLEVCLAKIVYRDIFFLARALEQAVEIFRLNIM